MVLGRIPGLALDRTGIAMVGAIGLLVTGRVTTGEAWRAIDVSTILLLLGLMLLSAQFRLGGFYARITRRLAAADVSPPTLLALLTAVVGVLSALLANDIVCLAVTPVLVEGCTRRRLNPVPFLLALACASNVGSAATLIGNPQNMLIGQQLDLSFAGYLLDALVPSVLGLVAVWWIINRQFRGQWEGSYPVPEVDAPPFNAWQTGKGLALLAVLMLLFLFAPWPRDVMALAAGGLLLASRRTQSGAILGLVDWHLLVLFAGLFVVNHAVAGTGLLTDTLAWANAAHIPVQQPAWLFAITVVLSNLVSNVPAVMLLLPAATHPMAGPVLALASTLAGNLFIVGSIANIIVVDQAARLGVPITWKRHAAVGIPVTFLTLALAAGWLYLRS
jgi:Na+/H+ antiporter NhaD/arsenite permease-like protein